MTTSRLRIPPANLRCPCRRPWPTTSGRSRPRTTRSATFRDGSEFADLEEREGRSNRVSDPVGSFPPEGLTASWTAEGLPASQGPSNRVHDPRETERRNLSGADDLAVRCTTTSSSLDLSCHSGSSLSSTTRSTAEWFPTGAPHTSDGVRSVLPGSRRPSWSVRGVPRGSRPPSSYRHRCRPGRPNPLLASTRHWCSTRSAGQFRRTAHAYPHRSTTRVFTVRLPSERY
jgi:hypothetical protein